MIPHAVIVGGGMITHDQLLPSLFQLVRQGDIGDIAVCGLTGRVVTSLAQAEAIRRAFPDQRFRPYPGPDADQDTPQPALYREVIGNLPPDSLVVIALPDDLHYDAILAALGAGHHVVSVKPLVLSAAQAEEIEREALARGLFVGIEYHKRFDDRSLMARQLYRQGRFGEFRLGTARLFEKWHYQHSNFQNWFTVGRTDPFTYIGCHYVDLVHFITGLTPSAVSVYGIPGKFPNGNEGYLWSDARVIWENGACLNVQNGLTFPDAAPGPNTQGISLYCAGEGVGALIEHSDQYRGLKYCYTEAPQGPGATQYAEPSPDYFLYVDLGGTGLAPVGYGVRSVHALARAAAGVACARSLAERQEVLRAIDAAGVLATPANSRYNGFVIEAARASLACGGREIPVGRGFPA